MHPLLGEVIDAHGGLERWITIHAMVVDVSIHGALWNVVGMPTAFEQTRVISLTRSQHLELDRRSDNRTLILHSGAVELRNRVGDVDVSVPDARQAFSALNSGTTWNDIQAAYFNGYALWQYLTAPFLYTYPGFEVAEMEPWEEEGETWRVLRVTFPESIVAHTRVQYAYVGPDRLVRRLRYTVDVLGGARGVNYADNYQLVDGIQFPLTRTVYAYGPDLKKIADPVLVSIQLGKPSFVYQGTTSPLEGPASRQNRKRSTAEKAQLTQREELR